MANKQIQTVEKGAIGSIDIPQELIDSMEKAVTACVPHSSKAVKSIKDSVVIAKGLIELRKFFQNEEVKKLVITMQDTAVGFLTDREPAALAKANAKKTNAAWRKDPYTYEEIVEALIPPMLEGYRFTGNEINIIAGNGMRVKVGKYNRIKEQTESFTYFIGTPVRADGVAKIRCQARWSVDGEEKTIGYGEDDKCVIMIDVGQYDGIDKLVGLSESKLFSRVLTRISGKLIIEGDLHPEDKDITPETGKTDEAKPAGGMNIMQDDSPPKVSFVEKLTTIVDEDEYKPVIQSLINEKKITNPDQLRTKNEDEAKNIFEMRLSNKKVSKIMQPMKARQ